MKFLAVSTNVADPRPYISDEAAEMGRLTAAGVVEHVYLKADWSGAVLIVEAPDQTRASDQLAALPLVSHGVTTFALTPLADSMTG